MSSSSTLADRATSIVRRLREAGHQAYFAGGFVRDMVLRRPRKDIDIATSATPSQVQEIFPKTVPVGAKYGVVVVLVGNASFEVATFRSDGPYMDGRHPESVRFTSVEEDVKRRDFTINGLLYDPLGGDIIDLVDGQEDIRQGVIRCIGSPQARFEEDRLRMLRAVRFAADLGYRIDPQTFVAIRHLRQGIVQVSPERIRDELTLMLTQKRADMALRLLDETGLLAEVLPEVSALKDMEQSPPHHPEGDVWTHTLLMLQELKQPSVRLAYGVLLHDIGKPQTQKADEDGKITFHEHEVVGANMAAAICQRLKLTNRDTAAITSLVRQHLKFFSTPKMKTSTLKRFLATDNFDELLELHRLDLLASNGNMETHSFCVTKLQDYGDKRLRPVRLLGGNDLIEMGYEPGPLFRRILVELEEAQLEETVRTREEAVRFVRDGFPLADDDEQ